MAMLVILSGALPYSTPLILAEGQMGILEPNVSADINGEQDKEVTLGGDYQYNINVILPENLTNYESLTIADELNQKLAVQKAVPLINGKVDNHLKVVNDNQKVSLALSGPELQELSGKEIKLQITTELKEDIATDEQIKHSAQVVVNDSIWLETNSVVMTIIDSDDSKKSTSEETTSEKAISEKEVSKMEEPEEASGAETHESEVSKSNTSTNAINDIRPAAFNPISQHPQTTILGSSGEGTYIDYDYSFTPRMTEETELTVTAGANTDYHFDNDMVIFTPQSGTTVSGELYYTNVGMYNHEKIDIKIEISAENIERQLGANLSRYLASSSSHPGPLVNRKMTFISQNTGQPIEVAGYVSFRGITGAKYLDWNTPIKDIFAIDGSQITYEDTSDGIRFFSTAPGGSTDDDTKMTIVFEPTSTIDTVFDGQFSSVHGAAFEQFSLTGIETPSPTKSGYVIEDRIAGENEYPNPREKVYEIVQNVPYQSEVNYFSSFEITDALDDILLVDTDDITVRNTSGDIVTNLFDIMVEDQNLSIKAKTGTLSNADFYNQQYTVTINGAINLSSDYSSYVDENGYISVPNTAITTIDNESLTSNEANAKFKYEEPIDPPNACEAPVALLNGSFEEPLYSEDNPDLYGHNGWFDVEQVHVPGWETTDPSNILEIMNKSLGDQIEPGSPYESLKVTPADGQQFAELNSREAAQLYQDVETTPGQTINWRLAHKGRLGPDTMAVKIGSSTISPEDLPTVDTITTDEEGWQYYSGTYTVPSGQTVTRFGFEAISSASGSVAAGNFLDDIFLGTEPCVVAEKTVSPEGEVFAGQELTYQVNIKNTGGDIAADTTFEDAIPAGTEYVPGSLKIIDGPGTGDLTDEAGDDAGHFDGEKVIVELGDLPNINELPDGITVQFKVKALVNEEINEILNQAQVAYDNLLTNERKETESNEVNNPLTYEQPNLESEKASEIHEKAEGNTDAEHPEVGDTLTYTIQTRNTIEDSLVSNLTISDALPEGLEYVEGTLTVDDQAVTDAEGDDAGHSVDGDILGQFGDVTDTEWHTLTFQVVVGEGQAGQDIENIATVDGDNIDDPDKPNEEVKVYPREPRLESEKTAVNLEIGKERFEVGDTVVYTIQSRNTVTDSVVENFVLSDVLPEGLTYVEGSIEVSEEGEGTFENGTITATFGDVADTEWRTVSFLATIDSGLVGNTIENVATADGDNVDDPDKPSTDITIDPKEPKLESTKTASIAEKAEGNTDAEHPEVGDTLTYTIQTRNTIEDSLVSNLTISDVLPEGLEYVEGTLTVDDQAVTDAEGDDAGHSVDGDILGQFGDVTDTEWHTLTFQVVVGAGQAGQDIENIATVDGDNIDDPDKPNEEVKVYPREPNLESEKTSSIVEKGEGNTNEEAYQVGDTIEYTIQSRNTVTESIIENFVISDQLPEGLTFVEGSLEVSHEGSGTIEDGTITASFGDVTDTEWRTVTFQATIDSGLVGNTIENVATADGDNVDDPDKPSTDITIDPKEPKLESTKTASIAEKAEGNTDAEHPEVGDTLTYTIQTRNTIEDSLVSNLTISDVLPEGLEYVEGTLTVDDQAVTDAEGDDAGHSVDGDILGQFGDVTDTEWHTLTFQVVVGEGQAGQDIENIATVDGDNIDDPDKPNEEVKVYPREPNLESEKTSSIVEKGEGNTNEEAYQVGDTIEYTIQSRNTVTESIVENFVISDQLPEGLTFVEGSLEVSHEGTGTIEDGTITASFGDVTDTEWRTVTFQATIAAGQSGRTIENTATVDGDNVDDPDTPENEIIVDPREPNLESEKTSSIVEKGEGNTDTEKYQVGDTIEYTIQSRNTVTDSIVENFVISDVLPEGLTFVEGSLEVSHEGTGTIEDGTITASFGDVTDTEWRTVTFQATIAAGQSGKTIENTATVDGDNVDDPDTPENKIIVDPKGPKLESEKASEIHERAEGNTDADHPEVGDTLTYTIQTRNTIEDSLVSNLTISDVLPEGLEYVADSLTVDGEAVTDAEGDDAGHSVDGAILGEFGDVTDTEWHTLTFQVVVGAGQAGQDIENIATVDGDNIDDPDKPNEEVKVYPREPNLASEKTSSIVEKGEGNTNEEAYQVGDTIEYTIQSRNTVTDSIVENFVISDVLPEGLSFVEGSLEVSHEGTGHVEDGTITASFGYVTDTEWRTVTFQATIAAGQSGKAIENTATVDGDNVDDPDTPENEIIVDPREPKLESEKTAVNLEEKEEFQVGDTVVYTIQTRNTVEDSIIENLEITDVLPDGLAYVEGSLEVSEGGTGDIEDGTITVVFGDVTNTEWHTITFHAKIESGQSGKSIENVATVNGKNIDDPDQPSEEITVNPHAPKLESEKTAVNLAEEKEEFQVGDTVVYTIQARNTVKDSIIENLEITDVLPEGLAYVEGSLEVSHEGTADINGGTITASFGDVTDTEWRTVTFHATIETGYEGTSIENVATVEATNIEVPGQPTEEIVVEEEVTSPPDPSEEDPQEKPEVTEPKQPEQLQPIDDEVDKEEELPNTATNNMNLILVGLLLLLSGATILYRKKKKGKFE